MQANAQILPIGRLTANRRFYPREVLEKAIAALNNKPIAIVHQNSYREGSGGPPKISDLLGIASNVHVDESTGCVVAAVRIDIIPNDLRNSFEIASAGFGTVTNGTVTDYTFTSLALFPR